MTDLSDEAPGPVEPMDPALLEIQVQSQVYAWLSKLESTMAVRRVIDFAKQHAERAIYDRTRSLAE